MKNPAVAEAKKLLAEGFEKKTIEELVKLLGHPHRGVRLEAQFALAAKGVQTVTDIVRMMSLNPEDRVARLHGVWALAMIAKNEEPGPYKTAVNKRLEELLSDRDPQVRAQAAKSAMDAGAVTYKELLPLLRDAELQVRMSAALAIAKDQPIKAVSDPDARGSAIRDGLFAMLRNNNDGDAYLRHAGAEALAKQVPAKLLLSAVEDKSPAVPPWRGGCPPSSEGRRTRRFPR